MQDVRIRTGVAALLSLGAFVSIHGAVAVFIWWLIFTKRAQIIKKIRLIFPLVVLIAFFSIVLELTGGGGLSYLVRMMVIILIGMWMYCEQQKGEFLNLGVWLFGDKAGFELGMLAEMGIQSLDSLVSDITRIRMAECLKGIRWGIQSLVPAGLVLVHGALSRADDAAELMAVRGYHNGGTLCPQFVTTTRDIAAGLCAICVAIIAFIPVSEFFILYR
jgi:energy-coupling factor transport system permease protein